MRDMLVFSGYKFILQVHSIQHILGRFNPFYKMGFILELYAAIQNFQIVDFG